MPWSRVQNFPHLLLERLDHPLPDHAPVGLFDEVRTPRRVYLMYRYQPVFALHIQREFLPKREN